MHTEKILKEKSFANLTNSDLQQQSRQLILEENEATWNFESSGLDGIMGNSGNSYIPKRKKKKMKPLVIEEPSNASMPSTVQLEGNVEDLKL